CDYAFLADLKAACRSAYPQRNNPKHPDSKQYLNCVDQAQYYYTAVDQYAGGAYTDAQAEACLCCQNPPCGGACCDDPCMQCTGAGCEPKSCGLCEVCNPTTGACESTCAAGSDCCAETCCDQDQVCRNGA